MDVDLIIIGAGAIGLSIAREISQNGHSVVILEKESYFGQGSSSRNSEVIHRVIHRFWIGDNLWIRCINCG